MFLCFKSYKAIQENSGLKINPQRNQVAWKCYVCENAGETRSANFVKYLT